MKKIVKVMISALLALILLLSVFSCTKNEEKAQESENTTQATDTSDTSDTSDVPQDPSGTEPNDPPESTDTVVKLNSNTAGIKILGVRGLLSDTQINCDYSGSGIEFSVFLTDRTLSFSAESSAPCYFKAYVDGEEWKTITGDTYYELNGKGIISLSGLPAGQHTVRLVKATEASIATAQLTAMTFTGVLSSSTPADNANYIEFVGGANCVGKGNIGADDGYKGQDATLAYSYLLAQALGADYSVTAMSQSFPLSVKAEEAKAMYLLSSAARDGNAKYGFERKATAVVVDLGASDFALNGKDGVSAQAFAEAYESLLLLIRDKNGSDCKIICVYDSANGEYASAISDVAKKLGGQKAGYYTCQMDTNGDGKLSAEEQNAFLDGLSKVTDNALRGVITEKTLDVEEKGDGLSVSYGDLVTLR